MLKQGQAAFEEAQRKKTTTTMPPEEKVDVEAGAMDADLRKNRESSAIFSNRCYWYYCHTRTLVLILLTLIVPPVDFVFG